MTSAPDIDLVSSGTSSIVAEFAEIGDLRVWSVIVTIFGDLAQARSDRISGPVLARLCEGLGIRADAMRVALHRLRRDGWILSEKSGRTSEYFLSDSAFRESLAARPKIYGPAPDPAQGLCLAIARPMTQNDRAQFEPDLLQAGAVSIASGVYLLEAPLVQPEAQDFLQIAGPVETVPDWVQNGIANRDLADGYARLALALSRLDANVDECSAGTAFKRALLRVLVVHNWRRLVLRHPALPERFFPEGWQGEACRGLVAQLLSKLPRPDLGNI